METLRVSDVGRHDDHRKGRALPPLKSKPLAISSDDPLQSRILNVKPLSLKPLSPLADKHLTQDDKCESCILFVLIGRRKIHLNLIHTGLLHSKIQDFMRKQLHFSKMIGTF